MENGLSFEIFRSHRLDRNKGRPPCRGAGELYYRHLEANNECGAGKWSLSSLFPVTYALNTGHFHVAFPMSA
mgnify:CR=1 FL=1